MIITTPDTLMQAFKAFMWKDPEAEAYYTKAGDRWGYVRGVDPSNTKRKAFYGDELPPIHPLFRYMNKCKVTRRRHRWRLDEKQPLQAGLCGRLRRRDPHQLQPEDVGGATGSPPCTRSGHGHAGARQAAPGLLDRQGAQRAARVAQEAYYSVHGGGENMIRRDTITELHNRCIVRIDSTVDLAPRTDVKLQFDPFIGRRADGAHSAKQMARHDTYR